MGKDEGIPHPSLWIEPALKVQSINPFKGLLLPGSLEIGGTWSLEHLQEVATS